MEKQTKLGIGLLAIAGSILAWLVASAKDDVDDNINSDLDGTLFIGGPCCAPRFQHDK